LTCVGTVPESLYYLRNRHPALFLLDIEMIGMNGFELAKEIRALGIKTPIIFITANSSKEWIEKAIKCGAADFITKPTSKGLLVSKIDRALGYA
jgi:CheY-like chemotaxis protein